MAMDTSARNIYRIMAIIGSFVLLVLIAVKVHRELIWIGTAFFLAVALNPAVEFFRKRLTKGQRGLAIAVTLLIFFLSLALLVASLVPPIVHQSKELVNHFPEYTDKLINAQNFVGRAIRRYDLVARVKADQAELLRQASQFGGSFFVVLRGVFTSLAATITVLALTFFMLLEGPGWLDQFWSRYHTPNKRHHQKLIHEMYQAVTGYVNGNVLTSLIAGLSAFIMMEILRIPYSAPLAIFVGIFDLVPLVGATIASLVVVAIALFQSTTAAIIMLIFFIVYQQLENHLLQPVVYGKTVRISPLLVLIAVLIGAGLGKLLGALVAIPVAASLQIVAKDYLNSRQDKSPS